MNRAELLNDLRVFLADASEGSFTFSDEACWAALEKAQEKCAAVLGLTYVEPYLAVDGNNEVEIPVDAISVTRVEIGTPPPSYSILVTPSEISLTMGGSGGEAWGARLSVAIVRDEGFVDSIDVSWPNDFYGITAFHSEHGIWVYLGVQNVDEANATLLEAEDSFDIAVTVGFSGDALDTFVSNAELFSGCALTGTGGVSSNYFQISPPS